MIKLPALVWRISLQKVAIRLLGDALTDTLCVQGHVHSLNADKELITQEIQEDE